MSTNRNTYATFALLLLTILDCYVMIVKYFFGVSSYLAENTVCLGYKSK